MASPCRDDGVEVQKGTFLVGVYSVGNLQLCSEALFVAEIVRLAAAILM